MNADSEMAPLTRELAGPFRADPISAAHATVHRAQLRPGLRAATPGQPGSRSFNVY
jgi:hypothetical protein